MNRTITKYSPVYDNSLLARQRDCWWTPRCRPEAGEDARASSLVVCQPQAKTINASNIAHVAEIPRTQNTPFQLMHPRPQSSRCLPHNHRVTKNGTLEPCVEMKPPRVHVHYSLLEHLNYLSLSLCFEGPSKALRTILYYFMLKTHASTW